VSILLPSRPGPAATVPAATDPTTEPTTATLPGSVNALLAGVVERLYVEYGCCLPLSDVLDVVAGCLDDIQTTSSAALPELTERLARHRLAEIGHRPGA
jgi:hypothetical protein